MRIVPDTQVHTDAAVKNRMRASAGRGWQPDSTDGWQTGLVFEGTSDDWDTRKSLTGQADIGITRTMQQLVNTRTGA